MQGKTVKEFLIYDHPNQQRDITTLLYIELKIRYFEVETYNLNSLRKQ